ncbi:MAG: hypothetical protein DRJ96_03830 [Thermoprotei archaeon]|nr:MAG: hypothetical protein DRJ96_03830 [Thermoprotei archaeon]
MVDSLMIYDLREIETAREFCNLDREARMGLVKSALVRVLSRHRGNVAYIRPRHIALELGMARWAAIVKKIAKCLNEIGEVRADGVTWRLEKIEVRKTRGKERMYFIYVRVN